MGNDDPCSARGRDNPAAQVCFPPDLDRGRSPIKRLGPKNVSRTTAPRKERSIGFWAWTLRFGAYRGRTLRRWLLGRREQMFQTESLCRKKEKVVNIRVADAPCLIAGLTELIR